MFGAEVLRSMQQGEPRVDIRLGGQIIFIAPIKGDNTAPPPSMPYRGLEHIGLSVTGIDQVVAELKAKGAEFTMEPTSIRPGIRICFVRGPENVAIELLERSA
jgi:catechol 2,3-dioxygenase-like lactoylglutathione lyase family enzyme